jgi:hypothetical protein
MARTSWQDLARDDPAGEQAEANDAAQEAAREAQEAVGGSPEQMAADAMREAGLPQSLQDVPELQKLLSERSQLEQALQQLTGGGAQSPGDTREARRFPMESSSSSPDSRLALRRRDRMEERSRDADRQAFAVDSLKGRRAEQQDEQRRVELADRAARRRRAGEDRVAQAAQSWDQHRSDLLAARDLAREAALGGRGLVLPGNDTSSRVARMAQGLANAIDVVDRMMAQGDSDPNRPAGRDRSDGAWGKLRDAAREARRWMDDPLGQTEAGRRLRALREELSPPEVRALPDYTGDGDVDVLDARRMRALAALRDRRADEGASRSDARDDSPPDRTTDDTAPRRRTDDTTSRRQTDEKTTSRRRTDDTTSRRRTDDTTTSRRRTDDTTTSRRRTDDTTSRRSAPADTDR